MTTPDNPTSGKPGSVALPEDDLHEIGFRCAHATPGPWDFVKTHPSGISTLFSLLAAPGSAPDGEGASVLGELCGMNAHANAEFVAHAREDVRRLVAEVIRLNREAAQHRETIKTAIPALAIARNALASRSHVVVAQVEAAWSKLTAKEKTT